MSMRRHRGSHRFARTSLIASAILLAAALVAGAAAARSGKAKPKPKPKPAIAVLAATASNSRLVVRVRITAPPAKARWRLRVDGKAVATLPARTRVASSPFLAPGDHRVQAQLVTFRGVGITSSTTKPAHVDVLVAAAGDIACDPADPNYAGTGSDCHMRQTAALVGLAHYNSVFLVGDEQYECGTQVGFDTSFGATWGKYKAISHPSPGDHEYGTTKTGCAKGTEAAGYYAYWGAQAGDPTKGYYSFDLANWHVVVLNSNCLDLGGCQAGSAEELWLQQDLAAHPSLCTVAYWHEPRFTSAAAGDNPGMDAFWRDLYAAKVDIVLNGHAHVYERYAPQTPDGVAAPDGITEIIAGTGGRSISTFLTPEANSVARGTSYGLLSLTLGAASFSWRFVPEQGATFTDAGTTACH
jgi:acid phosphatase type 7